MSLKVLIQSHGDTVHQKTNLLLLRQNPAKRNYIRKRYLNIPYLKYFKLDLLIYQLECKRLQHFFHN